MKPSETFKTIIKSDTGVIIESSVRSLAMVCVFVYVCGYTFGWLIHSINAWMCQQPTPSYHNKPVAPYVCPLYHLNSLSCKDLHAMGYKGRRKIQQLASLIAA